MDVCSFPLCKNNTIFTIGLDYDCISCNISFLDEQGSVIIYLGGKLWENINITNYSLYHITKVAANIKPVKYKVHYLFSILQYTVYAVYPISCILYDL